MQIAELFVRIRGDITGLQRSMSEAQNAVKSFGREMDRLGGNLTRALTLPLVGIGAAAGKAAIDFESSFAGIRKTVDMTESEFERLAAANRKLAQEIPVSVDELNRIGELAGQMGIEGVENILIFEDTIARLAVTTDLTADQAALSFAQIANVMQMPQSQIDQLGAVVVGLGNNFATVESQIVDFTQRIAGAGHIAKLSAADVAGIGTAFASLGIQAEAGGTAIQKALLAMVRATTQGTAELAVFAETAGMSAAEFKRFFEEDAAGAFASFVEGLGRQGDRAIDTLQRVGLADQRLMRAMLGAAGAGDVLRRAIVRANEEWEKNTALVEESDQRFETAASQLAILWNRIRDVGITLGLVLVPAMIDALDAMSPLIDMLAATATAFSDLPATVQTFVVALAGITAALGPLLMGLGRLLAILPAIQVAMHGLLGPIGLVTAALAVGGAAWIAWRRNAKDSVDGAKEAVEGFSDTVRAMSEEEMIHTVAVNLGRVEALRRMPQTEFIRGEIEKIEAETAAAVKRFNELSAEIRGTGNTIDTDLTDPITGTATEIEALRERVRTLLQLFEELGARGVDRSSVTQELVALERQIESLVRAQGDARTEALAEALRLSRQIRETLDGADPFRNFRPEGLATPGTHLTEEGRERFEQRREQRREFLDLGGHLDPVEARGRGGAITPDADPAGGLMGKLAEIGNEVGAQIKAMVAKFGPLAAVAIALKPVFEGLMDALKPILDTLIEPLRTIGQLIAIQIGPILKMLAPPLRLLATVTSYVVEGFGYLVLAVGKAAGALTFGLTGKKLRRTGQDMIDGARDARAALKGAGDDVEEFGDTVADVASALSNVPEIFDLALRRRMAMLTGDPIGQTPAPGGGDGDKPARPTPPPPPPRPDPGGRGPIQPWEREPTTSLQVNIHNPPANMDVREVTRQVTRGIVENLQRGGASELTVALRAP